MVKLSPRFRPFWDRSGRIRLFIPEGSHLIEKIDMRRFLRPGATISTVTVSTGGGPTISNIVVSGSSFTFEVSRAGEATFTVTTSDGETIPVVAVVEEYS